MISTYNAYDKGFLPSPGGMDSQPSLFSPLMSVISTAIEEERELAQKTKSRTDRLVQQSQAEVAQPKPGYAPLAPPKRGR